MQSINFDEIVLGIEWGSSRIKAVLIDKEHKPIASGGHAWENRYENGIWTYSMEAVWDGLHDAYANLVKDVKEKYDTDLTAFGAMGVSGMMHGHLPFDKNGRLLVPFRTWRNTITGEAAGKLTELFGFNIPQRWSIAHLYQAILNGEEHVKDIAFITTLAGYVHWQLTGEKVVGIGEASGMFPIDSETLSYDAAMLDKFDTLIADKNYPWHIRDILPGIRVAGESAGALTATGAMLLDMDCRLRSGIPVAPPEGDAGTGMVATNAVAARTGNVSAGTSIFSMVVLEGPLSKVYPEIDLVTTPTGKPVAMVHCNNCTSDMDAWASLIREALSLFGAKVSTGELFTRLYNKSLEGEADCGGVMVVNYLAGEPLTGFTEGCPLVVRSPESRFTLANFLRAQLYSTMATLKIGMDILAGENVTIDRLMGHGGLFKTPVVGQKYLAAATDSPVSVMETAGEGGPYGMALLAAYMLRKGDGETLEAYLKNKVYAGAIVSTLAPEKEDVKGFNAFLERYEKSLAAEKAAVENLKKVA
jgi:sugar (pentulose or hexulose) kinase